MTAPLFLTAEAAAKALGMTPESFQAAVESGYLPPGTAVAHGVARWTADSLRAAVESPEPGVLSMRPPVPIMAQGWARHVLHSNLSPTTRVVAAAVALDLAEGIEPRVTVQMGTLGKTLHMGPGSIRSALGTLEHLGWLEPCGGNRSQGQRIYALRIPQEPVEGGAA